MLRSLIEVNGFILIIFLIRIFATVAGKDAALDHHAAGGLLSVVAASGLEKFGKLVKV